MWISCLQNHQTWLICMLSIPVEIILRKNKKLWLQLQPLFDYSFNRIEEWIGISKKFSEYFNIKHELHYKVWLASRNFRAQIISVISNLCKYFEFFYKKYAADLYVYVLVTLNNISKCSKAYQTNLTIAVRSDT